MDSCCRCLLLASYLCSMVSHVTALPFAETLALPRSGSTWSSHIDEISLSLKPKKVYKHPIRVPSKVFPDAERTLGSRSFAELNPADKTSMATEVAKTFQLPSLKYEPCEGSCWQKEAGREVMTVVDCALAGLGLTASLAVLSGLEKTTGAKMFCAPMISSGVVFFIGNAPPNAIALCIGTAGAMAVYHVLEVLREYMGDQLVTGATAGCMLMWYRLTNSIFVPATSLGFLIPHPKSDECSMIGWEFSRIRTALRFLLFPWISGHSLLYIAALVVAWIRARVRHLILSIAETGCSH
mmetsp:Transcript_51646/g.121232  ORF Transcript_51646/g.121232 Transcript_51646/m.121232 type:complete len:296 (+) Transcript_51646:134-1021(+)